MAYSLLPYGHNRWSLWGHSATRIVTFFPLCHHIRLTIVTL